MKHEDTEKTGQKTQQIKLNGKINSNGKSNKVKPGRLDSLFETFSHSS